MMIVSKVTAALFCALTGLFSICEAREAAKPIHTSPNDVPALIKELSNSEAMTRTNAALRLGFVEPPEKGIAAIPPLIVALQDTDYGVRHTAAEALGHLPATDDSQRALFELLVAKDVDLHWVAANSIRGRVEDLPRLIAALENPDHEVRTRIVPRIGILGPAGKDAIPALLIALTDKNQFVRACVPNALGAIAEKLTDVELQKKVAAALVKSLRSDPYDYVRAQCALTLEKCAPLPQTEWPELLKSFDDKDDLVRLHLSAVLGKSVAAAASNADLETLNKPLDTLIDRTHADSTALARHSAVTALGQIGAALNARVAHDASALRNKICMALIEFIADRKKENYRESAVAALAQAGTKADSAVLDALIAALEDPSDAVRTTAPASLAQLSADDARSIEALQKCFKADSQPAVRQSARAALEKMNRKPTE